MFETIFNLFSAWNAILYLIAGGTVSGIGLLIVGYSVYVRSVERRYQGEVVGVRNDGPGAKTYWPLIAYVDESGLRHEVLANAGSSLIGGRTPGTKVSLYADSAAPRAVMLVRDWWFLFLFGAIFAAAGSPFLGVGISMLRLNWSTGIVVLAGAFYLGFKFFRFIHPLLDARKAGGWAAAREAFMARTKQNKHSFTVSNDEIAAVAATQSRQSAGSLPVLALVGAALLLGGGYWFERQYEFLSSALSAQGTVLRNEESDSGDSVTYHAVVAFTDRAGREITYSDSVGSEPPMYSTGDKVTVLYAPADSTHAEIDRGHWNWLVPLLIAAAGALLLGLAAYSFLTRKPASTPAPTPTSKPTQAA